MTSAYASSILRKTLCHASQSQKLQNQPKRAKFPKNGNHEKPKPLSFMLLLFALLCGWPAAWGQTEPDEWDGSASGTFVVTKDYSRNSDCDIAKGTSLTLNVTGNNLTLQVARFKLEDGDASTAGGELNIIITGNNVTFDFVQILINGTANINNGAKVSIINSGTNFKITKRGGNMTQLSNGYISLFSVSPYGSLEIKGASEDKKVTIDGGWTMDDKGIPTNAPNFQFGFGVLYTTNGKVTFENILIRNFVSYLRGYNANTNQGEGCLLRFNGGSPSTEGKHSFKNVEITKCYAGPTNLELNNGYSYGRIIGMYSGIHDITFEKVHIHHCFVHEPENSNAGIFGMGGIIRSQGSMGGTLKMKNCTINDNRYMNRRYFMSSPPAGVTDSLAGQGGAINWRSGLLDDDYPQHKAKIIIENSKFYNNMAKQGGAIATNGALDLSTNVEIYNNFAAQGGGVYFWTYNGMQDTYDGRGFDAIFGNGVNIHHNEAKEYGGGSYVGIEASNDVGFKAKLSGEWNPATDTVNPLFRVKINTGATIQNNKAPKGAGIAIRDAAPYRHKNTQEKLTGNSSVDNPAYNEWSGIYERQVIVAGGTVCNNTAQGTAGTEMAGAGIYIEKYPYPSDHAFYPDYGYSDEDGGSDVYGAGTLTVDAESGLIYGNTAINGSTTGLGGGMYIASNFTDNTIVSTLNVNIGKAGKDLQIYNNQAYTDGGGVYVLYDRTDGRKNQGTVTVKNGSIGKTDLDSGNKALNGNGGGLCVLGGTVNVEGGNVEYNTADQSGGGVYVKVPNNESITIIQGGANISNNKALNGDGGGVYLYTGKINIYGSNISHNAAIKGNGGGIYTNEGDILVWPTAMKNNAEALISQCELTKTTVSNNTAGGNGGGLNTHVGRFDVRFAQITENIAGHNYSIIGNGGGNGGGLFCNGTEHDNGYTVRLLHCDLEENKAYGNVNEGDNITGRGGGVYLKYGSIFAEHCEIVKNEADINGGGLDNHSGELRVYGSYIDENVAKTGRGGGLYTEEGNIVVGPCDTYGYTASKASRIIKNKAKINGGGINNHKGDITIHGDRINENIAEDGDGGGVYINEGNIYMYGGQINNNKADKGKGGGVYGGGGKFKIEERKANPIVEIMEVEKITAIGFDVHYHLVDRGLAPITVTGVGPDYTYADPGTLTHGIAYSTRKPTQENPWVESDTTEVVFKTSQHSYVLSEGCVRVPSGRLHAYTTYYVIAWAKYTISSGENSGNYYDASPVVQITTIGSINPLVATGVASEITLNSAKVTGELLYEGDGSGIVTKGIRYRIGEGDWTDVASSDTEEEFSVTLAGLAPDIEYQAQAYATKGENTGYGEIITFTTATGGKASQGPCSVYPAVEENPFFQELTPLQQAMLANVPDGDTTAAAPATRAITDRDDPNPQPPVDIPEINENTARYGGGICIDKQGAELIFAGAASESRKGQININFASEAGGGIYIGRESVNEYAQMQMMDKCEVNYNYVPTGKLGGGIYLDGRLYVGENDTDAKNRHGLRVDRNFTSDIDTTAWMHYTWTPEYNPGGDSKLNNVFLPRSEYDYDEHSDGATTNEYNKISVITLLSDLSGKDASNRYYSHIGFSVPKGFCPVIATAKKFGEDYKVHDDYAGAIADVGSEEWLYNLMNLSGEGSGNDQTSEAMRGAVFEDSESYVAVHTRSDMPPFRMKYIYLWGCWTHPVVNEDPERNTGYAAGLPENDQSMVGTGKHYKITKDDKNILTWEIYSPEGLSWFTSYVNGLNAFDEKTGDGDDDPKHAAWDEDINPYAKAYIMNDLDMSAYLWVPIGSVQKFYKSALTEQGSLFVDSETHVLKEQQKIDPDTEEPIINPETGEPETEWVIDEDYSNNKHYYRGTFDGQGHIIKGLQGLYLTGIEKFGLFGYLADSAVVKNTFVDEGLFVSDNVEVVYSAGGIAGTMQNNKGKIPVVSNSEARMSMNVGHCDYGTNLGGLVGEMKAGIIHSCMAMPTMVGQLKGFSEEKPRIKAFEGSMGGLVGKLGDGCSLKNSFANVKLTLIETAGATVAANADNRFLGGITGENKGTIENVYVRYNNSTNTPDLTNTQFYWIAGSNANGTINYPYTPNDKTGEGKWWYKRDAGTISSRSTYTATHLESNKYGFAQDDQKAAAFIPLNESPDSNGHLPSESGLTYDKDTHTSSLNGLMGALNNWVAANPGHTFWTRTMASTINDDYPVLMFNDFNVVGTEDGIYMKYDDNVNDMWKKPNYESLAIADRTGKDFQGLTSYNNPKAAMYLYNTNPTAVNVSENEAVRLYIHENVGITQTDGAELHARVGVTFDNSNKSLALGGKAYDWHMFSSALQNAPMGLKYYRDDTENYKIGANYNTLVSSGIDNDNYISRAYMDPPRTTWRTHIDSIGYFPTDTPYGTSGYTGSKGGNPGSAQTDAAGSFDLYCFHEGSRHWINFKREGTKGGEDVIEFFDHWHQDAVPNEQGRWVHKNINYKNENKFLIGKGYMMGVSKVSMLMADGILNNGAGPTGEFTGKLYSAEDLSNSDYGFNPSGYSEELRGTNLVGNPFQSYLDFSALANDDANKNIINNGTYYLFDADAGRYLCYPADASANPINAPRYIHPHQGFFVKTVNSGKLTFDNSMRSATGGEGSTFRGDNLNYPLVNLFCYDAEGHYDVTTVEINRPKLGGGSKLKDMRNGNSLIYARMENEDYQTLFAPTGTSTVPVRFEPSQNGVYTMRWGTLHGDFSYLHLIDNLTGSDVDCLRQEEYRFEATTSDYISRFKLVFEATDVEENPIEAETATFAFSMGDEIIVNGAGYLEVFDMQGRRLTAKRLVDAQSNVSLPNVAAGIYFLRLSDDKQVRTQKMVINY